MTKIHNGFVNKNFIDSFKDTGLNDVDIATTKVYKGVKPMWQQLGFKSQTKDKPDSKLYWKNIIPEDFTFKNIDGIQTINIINEDDDSDIGITSGMKKPRTEYKEIIIREYPSVLQQWQGDFRPHYPVLPQLDKYGVFTAITGSSMFFGSKETWDGDDEIAPITNLKDTDPDLVLSVDFNQSNADDLIDKTNFNKVDYNKDFQLSLDENFRLKTDTIMGDDRLEKNKTKQAF